MKIASIKEVVSKVLTNHPESRDNDRLLILKVWAEEMPELRSKNMTFISFSHAFIQGKLPDTESVRRCRQKLQELHPELRGKNYKGKQMHQEDVKQELKEMS